MDIHISLGFIGLLMILFLIGMSGCSNSKQRSRLEIPVTSQSELWPKIIKYYDLEDRVHSVFIAKSSEELSRKSGLPVKQGSKWLEAYSNLDLGVIYLKSDDEDNVDVFLHEIGHFLHGTDCGLADAFAEKALRERPWEKE